MYVLQSTRGSDCERNKGNQMKESARHEQRMWVHSRHYHRNSHASVVFPPRFRAGSSVRHTCIGEQLKLWHHHLHFHVLVLWYPDRFRRGSACTFLHTAREPEIRTRSLLCRPMSTGLPAEKKEADGVQSARQELARVMNTMTAQGNGLQRLWVSSGSCGLL